MTWATLRDEAPTKPRRGEPLLGTHHHTVGDSPASKTAAGASATEILGRLHG